MHTQSRAEYLVFGMVELVTPCLVDLSKRACTYRAVARSGKSPFRMKVKKEQQQQQQQQQQQYYYYYYYYYYHKE
uniref:Uncharacterized protein n=1 Tax=Glossina brevipalpis TaxID=37001 RepID=A0A1A9WYB6_9MUSC